MADETRSVFSDPTTQTVNDVEFAAGMERHFTTSIGPATLKLENFTRYVSRQSLSLFLAKHRMFEKVVDVHGHIIECGVYLGGGLMTWAQLSAIYEPINHSRRVVGFDTFSGFTGLHEKDDGGQRVAYKAEGGLAVDPDTEKDLKESIRLFDVNRPIGQIPRVELVVGDAAKTIPEYLSNNPQLVVALVFLDFQLYEPTMAALEHFLPRMPKGAVLAFNELNQPYWPGSTLAVLEKLGLRNLAVRRFPFTPHLSYAVLD